MNTTNDTDNSDEELFDAFTQAGEDEDANVDFAWEAQAEAMDIE